MTDGPGCPRDHSRLPYRFLLGVKVTCGICNEIVGGSGWRCASCGWARLESGAWSRHVASLKHRLADMASQSEAQRAHPLFTAEEVERMRERSERIQRDRRAREDEAVLEWGKAEIAIREAGERERQQKSEAAAREAEQRERAIEAEAQRKQREAEREEAERKEHATAEVDRRLLAGQVPREISYSVGGLTEAQIERRRAELAKLPANRGKEWAEHSIDQEIRRLVLAGARRTDIEKQLGVGAHRVARVRRDLGLAGKLTAPPARKLDAEPEPISRRLPDPVPPVDDDDRRRKLKPEPTDEFGDRIGWDEDPG